MGIIGYIIIGFFAGLLARALKPGNDSMGVVKTTVIGIIGAVLAGVVGRSLGWYAENEPAGFLMSTVGAIVALFAYYAITGRRTSSI